MHDIILCLSMTVIGPRGNFDLPSGFRESAIRKIVIFMCGILVRYLGYSERAKKVEIVIFMYGIL